MQSVGVGGGREIDTTQVFNVNVGTGLQQQHELQHMFLLHQDMWRTKRTSSKKQKQNVQYTQQDTINSS